MSPTERNYILSFLVEEAQKIQEKYEEQRRELEQKRQNRK